MENRKIYEDIALRTDGEIYVGVVGPVRTGKSTFIKRFMESLVIPNIENVYRKERARDELPQSGSGRTIMTAEPKFVPEEAVSICIADNTDFKVRLIDCVGYMVPSALGVMEDGEPRMVTTPWFEQEIPMTQAAEIGTRKVIAEHSSIGIVMTCDGSITDIPREEYIQAEERVISELKEIGKPFVILLNCADPKSQDAQDLCASLAEKHKVTCQAVNCMELDEAQITEILRGVLYEFPVEEMDFYMPAWVDALEHGHEIKAQIYDYMLKGAGGMHRIRDVSQCVRILAECENICRVELDSINLGTGVAKVSLDIPRNLFYRTLSQQSGFEINDDGDLMPLLKKLSRVNAEYSKIENALQEVRETGYGIVMPTTEELTLEEPEIVKQGGRYGVRLQASAPSIHMMRADITTEVSPIVGSEKQSEELVMYMLKEFEKDPIKIWESNIFGKSLYELVNEGLHNKLYHMPQDARMKLQETIERIINEACNGLICIIL